MSEFVLNDSTTRAIAERLTEPFILLDVGCSGGIHPAWRAFGDKLRAFAFDPNIGEIERLRGKETNPAVLYEEAFIGLPPGHRLSEQLQRADFVRASPWGRLSVAQTLDARARSTDNSELTALNQWGHTALTDRSIYIPDYLRAKGVDDVDFVKVDVDGADLIVLQSIFESPTHSRILGMFLEVNFNGTAEPDHHTFHNTDRLMRQMGFDLFDLSVRNYSSSALPWPYAISVPAQTVNGRPFQGDALYMRDITAPHMAAYTDELSAQKIAKAAAIFAMTGHIDQAAEVLRALTGRLSPAFDVGRLLDALARQIQEPLGTHLSREEYLAAFAADDPMFYPGWRTKTVSDAEDRDRKSRGIEKRRSPWRAFKRRMSGLIR
jgi:FkbM family methyltransferase